MKIERIKAIAFKEATHIRRDPFTLVMAIVMPVVLVALFGLALDLDVKNIEIGVDDRDHSQTSRRLISIFKETRSFVVVENQNWTEPEKVIRSEKVKGVLVIPQGFEKNTKSGKPFALQFVVDGADNAIVGPALSYIYGVQLKMRQEIIGEKLRQPIEIEPRFLYNGELKSTYYIVPGLMSVVVALVSILLTALTISREWENGSMELLLSTPTRPIELIIGKILPYSLMGMFGIFLVYIVARVGFAVPFRGSHLVFLFACFIFLTAYLAQGILISVVARSQAVAMQIALVSGFLPTFLLSGFVFSVASMPKVFQVLTNILPARYFLQIVRTLFLKEAGFLDVWPSFLFLIILNFLLINVARKKFKRTVE